MDRVPRGYHPPLSGLSPDGRETWEFLISVQRLKDIQIDGPRSKFYNARILKGVLESPTAILPFAHFFPSLRIGGPV
jgi:hypothetical protein